MKKIVLGSFISVFLLISILVIYNKNIKNINIQDVVNTTETSTNTNIVDKIEIESSVDDEDEENMQPVSPTITTSNKPQVAPTNTNVVTKKLSVSPRCIGCGKCARMDSTHFQMVGDRSTVISQNGLDSQKLQMIISMCPASAISIN